MILNAKTVTLKDGRHCVLRTPTPEDAEALLQYLRATSGETEYLVRYADEVTLSVEEEQQLLRQMNDFPQNTMLAAFSGDTIVGNIGLSPLGSQYKLRHRATFGMALRKEVWGLGLGTILLEEIISLARQLGYQQLELDVSGQNQRARALYEKLGFVACGELPRGFQLRSGGYASLVLMVKPL